MAFSFVVSQYIEVEHLRQQYVKKANNKNIVKKHAGFSLSAAAAGSTGSAEAPFLLLDPLT